VIAVVGADGFLGSALATAYGAERIVFRDPGPGEIGVGAADELLSSADIVVNAAGFRVRPGLTAADYRRSHAGVVSRLVPRLSPGALLVHISSASVLGRDTVRMLGPENQVRADTFASPAYAIAKKEAEDLARDLAASRRVKIAVVRPAIVYSSMPDGVVWTLLKLASKGVLLRLVPARHRHHLLSLPLLVETIRCIVQGKEEIEPALVVADPFVVTSAEIVDLARTFHRPWISLPIPAGVAGSLLRRLPSTRSPWLDFRTRGEILSILALDTVYDPSETYKRLAIDSARFSRERTWERLIRGLEVAP
jgi:nucleoside-diphosphate-sugar epimerase